MKFNLARCSCKAVCKEVSYFSRYSYISSSVVVSGGSDKRTEAQGTGQVLSTDRRR